MRVYLENAQSIRYHHLTAEEMLIILIHLDGLRTSFVGACIYSCMCGNADMPVGTIRLQVENEACNIYIAAH